MLMKSSWEKLKGLALSQHQNQKKDDIRAPFHHRPCPKLLDDFTQASKDMQDMKKCNDTILYAAAAAANSEYEFSESLREMGTCLLEQSALTDDQQSGNVLRILSKVQFELQELVDSYRSHVFQLTTPSESVLNQLQTVEGMKQQCDEKRNVYQGLLAAQMKMENSRSFKGETDSSQQLQAASNEYEREAICFFFRLKSLKEGQTQSLIKQAVQHHAAQVNYVLASKAFSDVSDSMFDPLAHSINCCLCMYACIEQISLFSKGLKSLEAVDQEVRSVPEHPYNDHSSSGLQDRHNKRFASLSGARNNLQYTSPLELIKKHEINLRADKTNESNIDRASNNLYPALSSQKLGALHDLPSPPSTRNSRLVRPAKVRRSEDLFATIENRLEYPRGHYMPSSDARFYHSAPMERSSDLCIKNEILPSPSNASTYPKLPRFPKAGCLGTQYVDVDDERAYHSAPLEISQDLYATTEIPWTPSNVTAYQLPLGTELPRGNYVPLTDERAKAILGSFRRGQTFGDLQWSELSMYSWARFESGDKLDLTKI
ncbi:hypothetical protein MKX01_001469 [Papaver californicum]|nr:hypothetical protein MKX01_001469 [Papaver californicum]